MGHKKLQPLLIIFLLLVSSLAGNPGYAEILMEKRSLYSNVQVRSSGSLICLLFAVKQDQRNQSCINTRSPKAMVFAYTKMTMASLLFNPDPQRILVVGLGGGTLPTAFAELLPEVEIDTLEIDPVVITVAEEYFNYQTSERQRVHPQDARIWVKRAVLNEEKFDLIILDAFNGDYIPEHLMTREFFQELDSLLTADGVLVANTFSISRLYDYESATFADVFGPFINFQLPESANRVVMAPKAEVSDDLLKARAKEWQDRLRRYAVPIRRFAASLIRQRKEEPDWDTSVRVLTDQYSPANILNEQAR